MEVVIGNGKRNKKKHKTYVSLNQKHLCLPSGRNLLNSALLIGLETAFAKKKHPITRVHNTVGLFLNILPKKRIRLIFKELNFKYSCYFEEKC